MTKPATPILRSAIAALASLFLFAPFTLNPADAAATCIAAPNAPAPEGSHWFYRLDHPSQRKCWHLVQQDGKIRRAVVRAKTRPASEQPAVPIADNSADILTEPAPQQAPAWITRNASDTAPDAAGSDLPPAPGGTVSERQEFPPSASAPQEQAQSNMQERGAPVEPPVQQSIVAKDNVDVSAATGAPTLQFAFVALAVVCFLASAILILSARRRRADVLTTALNTNTAPLEKPVSIEAATFAPLPPMEMISRHDDVEEALQRFSQAWRRRAA